MELIQSWQQNIGSVAVVVEDLSRGRSRLGLVALLFDLKEALKEGLGGAD